MNTVLVLTPANDVESAPSLVDALVMLANKVDFTVPLHFQNFMFFVGHTDLDFTRLAANLETTRAVVIGWMRGIGVPQTTQERLSIARASVRALAAQHGEPIPWRAVC